MFGLRRSSVGEVPAVSEAPARLAVFQEQADEDRKRELYDRQLALIAEAERRRADALLSAETPNAPTAQLAAEVFALDARLNLLRRPLPQLEADLREAEEASGRERIAAAAAEGKRRADAAVDRAHAALDVLERLAPQVGAAVREVEAARAQLAELREGTPSARGDTRGLLDRRWAARLAIADAAKF
jgi:hypothetical protein